MSGAWSTSNSVYGSFSPLAITGDTLETRIHTSLAAERAAERAADLKVGEGIRLCRVKSDREESVAQVREDGICIGSITYLEDTGMATIVRDYNWSQVLLKLPMRPLEAALGRFFAPRAWRVSGVRLVNIKSEAPFSGGTGEATVEVDGVSVGTFFFHEDKDEAGLLRPFPPEVLSVNQRELRAAIMAHFGRKWY